MPVDITQAPYSCDNTGSADCTSALNTAIVDASAGGSKAGQELYAPAGVYKITAQGLNLTSAGTFRLRGDGPEQTIFRHFNPTASFGTFSLPNDTTLRGNIHLQDLTFDGQDGTSLTALTGIRTAGSGAGGVSGWRMIRVRVMGYPTGAIRSAYLMNDVLMDGCEFTGINSAVNPANSSCSAFSGSLTNSRIVNCNFHDLGTNSNAQGQSWAIYLNSNCSNNVISANKFQAVAGGCIQTGGAEDTANYNCTIIGNLFVLTQSNIAVEGVQTSGLIVSGNVINSSVGTGAITLTTNVNGAIITGNSINSVGNTLPAAGINLSDNCQNIFIDSNSIVYGGGNYLSGSAVQLFGGNNVTISRNNIAGIMYGVHCNYANANFETPNDIIITGNRVSRTAGGSNAQPGLGGVVYNAAGTPLAVAVLLNGGCSSIQVLDNRVSNMDYELAFARAANVTGTPTNVIFRSANIEQPYGHVSQLTNTRAFPVTPVNFRVEPHGYTTALPSPPYGSITTTLS